MPLGIAIPDLVFQSRDSGLALPGIPEVPILSWISRRFDSIMYRNSVPTAFNCHVGSQITCKWQLQVSNKLKQTDCPLLKPIWVLHRYIRPILWWFSFWYKFCLPLVHVLSHNLFLVYLYITLYLLKSAECTYTSGIIVRYWVIECKCCWLLLLRKPVRLLNRSWWHRSK